MAMPRTVQGDWILRDLERTRIHITASGYDSCSIGTGATIGARVVLGKDAKIEMFTKIDEDVTIGAGADVRAKHVYKGAIIEERACVGRGVEVPAGTRVGCHAFIGRKTIIQSDLAQPTVIGPGSFFGEEDNVPCGIHPAGTLGEKWQPTFDAMSKTDQAALVAMRQKSITGAMLSGQPYSLDFFTLEDRMNKNGDAAAPPRIAVVAASVNSVQPPAAKTSTGFSLLRPSTWGRRSGTSEKA